MRRETFLAAKLAIILCAFSGLATAQAAVDGKRTFSSTCASCHGLDGKGSERGPDIVNRRAIRQLPDAALFRIVHDGKPGTGMPPFRVIGDERINAIVAYLRTLQGSGAAVVLPGDPKAGRISFFGKAECSSCHTANREGGFIASDLSGYASGKTVDEIRSAIVEPTKNLDPRKRTVVVTLVNGNRLTGVARNEDNFSLQLQTLDGAFHLLTKSELSNVERQNSSLMPADYGSRLTRQEIDDLMAFLISITPNRPKPEEKE
jgi:putative heme-binding domain-containing protein